MDRTRSQCSFYALDRVNADGGYIGFCMSDHWEVQHVVHFDHDKVLTQFIPPGDLPSPWYSLFGFEGSVVTDDKTYRKPMPVKVMWRGVALLVVMILSWQIKRAWDRFWSRK